MQVVREHDTELTTAIPSVFRAIEPGTGSAACQRPPISVATSFTAPQVAGELARLCQEEELKPREALSRLLAQGEPLPDFGQALQILPSGLPSA